MILIALASVATAMAAAVGAAEPMIYEVAFVPLLKSEQSYARFGPVGPFYPEAAATGRRSGEAVLECRAAGGGALEKCKVVSDTPANLNFGAAARAMAERKRILVSGAPTVGDTIRVRVPFTLGAPASVAP